MTTEHFDAVVLGMGPGGETVAGRLLSAGKRVAVVERELIGGECAYWACIPSKTLLRPPEAQEGADRAAGTSRPDLDWDELRSYRDYMVRQLDDSGVSDGYAQQGATVVRGEGRIAGPGVVEVDGRRLETDHIVVATGSDAVIPPVPGLDDVGVWTNREATTLNELPARAVLIGGGPVGIELGQFLARFGTQVAIVQSAERLINREDPEVGRLVQEMLERDGIEVRVGCRLVGARRSDGDVVLHLDDGTELHTDEVVIGVGRQPRVEDIGLETLGVEPSVDGLTIDDRCRVTEGVWAVGDVTGVLPFTHVAQYQGRVVTDNICGKERRASYDGIPRVVFTSPEIAAVGLTSAQALEQGLDAATATVDLAESIARPWTYERDPRGHLGIVVDRRAGLLMGAWAVAPLAGEWIHQAALAIRAAVTLSTLLDGIAQFPTYSEAYLAALEQLES
ncbi:NAD(P)/FAD-dependent oxidoreductase [soil metagenome]